MKALLFIVHVLAFFLGGFAINHNPILGAVLVWVLAVVYTVVKTFSTYLD